jgi:hypothetical protein
VLLYLGASACTELTVGSAVLPISGAFADTVKESQVWYTAGVRDRGDTLDAVLVLTNPTDREVRQLVDEGCTVLLVAFQAAERRGIPVWEDYERRLSDGSKVLRGLCQGFGRVVLPPRGRQELIEPIPKSQILEKLAPGEYYLSVRTIVEDTAAYSESRTLLLPAGSVKAHR